MVVIYLVGGYIYMGVRVAGYQCPVGSSPYTGLVWSGLRGRGWVVVRLASYAFIYAC
jgi:hypothetical protein